MAAMKPTTLDVLNYLKENNGKDLTSADVAEAVGLSKKQVDGIFTSFQKKKFGVREPAEIENADGSVLKVKYLRLTEAGLNFDPAAAE